MMRSSFVVLCAFMLFIVPSDSSAASQKLALKFSGSNANVRVSGFFRGIDGNGDGIIESDDPADTITNLKVSGILLDFFIEDPCPASPEESPADCKILNLPFSYSLGGLGQYGTFNLDVTLKTDLSVFSLGLFSGDQSAYVTNSKAVISDVINGRAGLTDSREIPISFSVVPVPAAIWFLMSSIGALIGFGRSSLNHRNRAVL
ncbi:hypothetical protein [Roseovarius litorisediminis]|nr:hypothetical protein [Roseovarius litorisediminis]